MNEGNKSMNYIEFGKENRAVIVLLHGGGLSWWNYKEAAEMLKKDYHKTFNNILKQARHIIKNKNAKGVEKGSFM